VFSLLALEELHGPFVLFRGRARLEGAKVPSLARFGVLLSRVQAVLAALQFPNHQSPDSLWLTRSLKMLAAFG
jgi:hypothetical protein